MLPAYVALTTFERPGEPVSTPVRVVTLGDGRVGVELAADHLQVMRLRREPRVLLRPSDRRGHPAPGSTAYAGRAEVVLSGGPFEETLGRLRRSRGPVGRFLLVLRPSGRSARVAVLVSLDQAAPGTSGD